jgi:tetratricopeptide (TPR) repeat protein
MARKPKRSASREPVAAPPPPPPSRQRPWAAAAAIAIVLTGAWFAADFLARRAERQSETSVAGLPLLPEPVREQIREAERAAQANANAAAAVGELGRTYHASLLDEPAIDAYAKAESLDPSAWQWPYLRGLVLEEHGRLPEAKAAFGRVVQLNEGLGLAWFKLAEIAFKDGALDQAEEGYRRAAHAPPIEPFTTPGVSSRRVRPLEAYATLGLARVAKERGQSQPATTAPDAGKRAYVPPADRELDAIVARSAMRDLLLKHAARAARGGDREWREFLVRRAAQFNPDDPNVLMETAAMLQATNRATEALEILRRHERLVPGDHHTLVEQGRSLADLGRLEEAEAVLRRAVRVRDAAAEYNLGTVLDRQGRTEDARERYERALAIDPFHSRALNNLGVLLDRSGQSDRAIATLKRSVEADPENAEAYSNLGSALIGARRLPEALRALDAALAIDPEAPDAHNNRGIALAQSGRFPEAAAEFETALRLNPNHANARRNIEQLRRMGR